MFGKRTTVSDARDRYANIELASWGSASRTIREWSCSPPSKRRFPACFRFLDGRGCREKRAPKTQTGATCTSGATASTASTRSSAARSGRCSSRARHSSGQWVRRSAAHDAEGETPGLGAVACCVRRHHQHPVPARLQRATVDPARELLPVRPRRRDLGKPPCSHVPRAASLLCWRSDNPSASPRPPGRGRSRTSTTASGGVDSARSTTSCFARPSVALIPGDGHDWHHLPCHRLDDLARLRNRAGLSGVRCDSRDGLQVRLTHPLERPVVNHRPMLQVDRPLAHPLEH